MFDSRVRKYALEDVRKVLPSHLQFIRVGRRKREAVTLRVVNPKLRHLGGRDEDQFVTLKRTSMPEEAWLAISAFAQLADRAVDWDKLVPRRQVIPGIRNALGLPFEKRFVFHSYRHGRATDLKRVVQMRLDDVQDKGRWYSQASMKIYLHA